MDRPGKSRPPTGVRNVDRQTALLSRYTVYTNPVPLTEVTSAVELSYDVIEGTEGIVSL